MYTERQIPRVLLLLPRVRLLLVLVISSFLPVIFSCNKTVTNVPTDDDKIDIILTQPWTPTGIQVEAGQPLKITAEGTMNWYTGACNGGCSSTPDGQPGDSQGFAFPGLACWSLVGKIGDNGEPFQVGSSYNASASASGQLFLGVNDNNYPDNTGSWQATVETPGSCSFADLPQVGDVVIYWNGVLSHSGYVSKINGCKVVGINTLWQGTAYYLGSPVPKDTIYTNINPDSTLLTNRFGTWTVYHTARAYQRKIKTVAVDGAQVAGAPAGNNNIVEGETDQGKIIAFNHFYPIPNWDWGIYNDNCHGYTFDCTNVDVSFKHQVQSFFQGYDYEEEYYEISGYADGNLNGNLTWHISYTAADQATAAKYILRDNGYKQVHAEGSNGKQHFNAAYEVAGFTF